VGFTPALLRSLNWPLELLKSRVVQGLELADQTGLPVFFHMDDIHFWYDRTDLHKNPDNVEWSAFPEEGETHGPIIPRYWLNWGVWNVFPAPPPCLESRKSSNLPTTNECCWESLILALLPGGVQIICC
jgi:hypothetical protein